MRRLAVLLLVGLAICMTADTARGQFSQYDTLGFGTRTRDTLRAAPDSFINIPVFLSTDSIVTGLSMLFHFDPAILWPQISFDRRYDSLLHDSMAFAPDSEDYQASPFLDSGLWNIDMSISTKAAQTWNSTYGTAQVLYNLRDRGHARLLLTPIPPLDPDNYIKPYIRGALSDAGTGGGGVIAYIEFKVNKDTPKGTVTRISLELQNEDLQRTELAEEWDSSGFRLTKSIIPRFDTVRFIADTGGPPPPPPGQNHVPVLTLGTTQTVFDIKQGDLVSFAVSATDQENGELRITANNGNLPSNATLAPTNPLIGGAGAVAGTFSFRPNITQNGAFAFSFVALDDSGATASKSVTVNVAELDIDRLFTSSADSLDPSGGVPGLTEVLVPIDVVSKKKIYGIQFDMTYDANNFDLDSIMVTDRIPDWIVYDNIGVQPGFLRVVAFGLANDSMAPGSSSAVLQLAFTVDEFAQVGRYPIDIYNAWESVDPDPDVPSLPFVTDSGAMYVDRWGDVNLDQRIDVADLVNVVAYIIGNFDLSRRQFATADIIINDTVNVVDLVGIINTIFGLPVSPSPSPFPEGEFALLKIAHDEIPGAGINSTMQVLADMPTTVAGVELEIRYNPLTIQMLAPLAADGSAGFRIRSRNDGNGLMKVLIYSDHPWNEDELIQEGLSDIIKLPFVSKSPIAAEDGRQVRITKAFVSTGAARNVPVEGVDGPALPDRFELYQNRPNPFNPTTIIDFYISGSGSPEGTMAKLEIFNILGQPVKTLINEPLIPGQYSVIWDGTDSYGAKSASGVYLYRLKVGNESQTKKMMLLK